jgi:hypothetical protein
VQCSTSWRVSCCSSNAILHPVFKFPPKTRCGNYVLYIVLSCCSAPVRSVSCYLLLIHDLVPASEKKPDNHGRPQNLSGRVGEEGNSCLCRIHFCNDRKSKLVYVDRCNKLVTVLVFSWPWWRAGYFCTGDRKLEVTLCLALLHIGLEGS